MSKWKLFNIVALLGMLGAVEGFAQKRGGRTDGPEGSEIGYGGYSRPMVSAFSLALDGGANFATKSGTTGTPMYIGGTASYWMTDWSALGVHCNYAFNTERFMALIGPSFRTDTWPLSFNVGLRAGIASDTKTRFAISPELGMDMLVVDHFIIGLLGAWDLPLGEGATPSQVRVGLKLGWRF
jgi:hypothetical protein